MFKNLLFILVCIGLSVTAMASTPFSGNINTSPIRSGNTNEIAYDFVTFGCTDDRTGAIFDLCIDTSITITQPTPTLYMGAEIADAYKDRYKKILVRHYYLVDSQSSDMGNRKVTMKSPLTPNGFDFIVPVGESVVASMISDDSGRSWHDFVVGSNNAGDTDISVRPGDL